MPTISRSVLPLKNAATSSCCATAGDAACDDAGLVPNSMHLRASVASDPTVRDVWIYIFREKSWAAREPPMPAEAGSVTNAPIAARRVTVSPC